jgi:hypothetical protein
METWTVRSLKWHTYKGVVYQEKDIYTVSEADAQTLEIQVRSLEAQGLAHRIDPTNATDPG